MTTRYYKATDGVFTVFRSTTSRTYAYADLTARDGKVVAMGFGNLKGDLKAVEIDKSEYQWLVQLKTERIAARRAELEAAGKLAGPWLGTAPSDSWVRNDALNPIAVQLVGLDEPEEDAPAPVPPKAETAPAKDPTKTTYLSLVQAYDYLNAELWAGKLPTCLVTLQRKANTRGYFAGGRFVTRDGKTTTDEIALNPSTFKERSTRDILSTLAHEMAHLDQHHNGKPGKGSYHNIGWVSIMLTIGLDPVSLDKPGQQTGNKVTHKIVAGGAFDVACEKLLRQGIALDYVESWSDEGKAKAAKKLKVRYSCGQCGVNCWAKPDCHFTCADCDEPLEPHL